MRLVLQEHEIVADDASQDEAIEHHAVREVALPDRTAIP